MVNGPERVFVERAASCELSGVRFRDASHVAHVCQRIASRVGRRIDESTPMVDARLKDGSRVNIVFPPLALDGPVHIDPQVLAPQDRLCQAHRIRLDDQAGGASAGDGLARASQRDHFGGTGSGKTTLLNALSRLIDIGERIVTIEDAAGL